MNKLKSLILVFAVLLSIALIVLGLSNPRLPINNSESLKGEINETNNLNSELKKFGFLRLKITDLDKTEEIKADVLKRFRSLDSTTKTKSPSDFHSNYFETKDWAEEIQKIDSSQALPLRCTPIISDNGEVSEVYNSASIDFDFSEVKSNFEEQFQSNLGLTKSLKGSFVRCSFDEIGSSGGNKEGTFFVFNDYNRKLYLFLSLPNQDNSKHSLLILTKLSGNYLPIMIDEDYNVYLEAIAKGGGWKHSCVVKINPVKKEYNLVVYQDYSSAYIENLDFNTCPIFGNPSREGINPAITSAENQIIFNENSIFVEIKDPKNRYTIKFSNDYLLDVTDGFFRYDPKVHGERIVNKSVEYEQKENAFSLVYAPKHIRPRKGGWGGGGGLQYGIESFNEVFDIQKTMTEEDVVPREYSVSTIKGKRAYTFVTPSPFAGVLNTVVVVNDNHYLVFRNYMGDFENSDYAKTYKVDTEKYTKIYKEMLDSLTFY